MSPKLFRSHRFISNDTNQVTHPVHAHLGDRMTYLVASGSPPVSVGEEREG